MLPPQLRQSLVIAQRHSLATLALKATSTTLLRASLSHTQSRSFFGWRRRADDWSSHLDPTYHRFCRFRNLQTRAKLLKNLRRRGKFNWDFDSKPFFTPQLVRWASHWDGKRRGGQWYLNDDDDAKNSKDEEGKKVVEEDGFELSPREKEWKEKMEAMRKRIEKDPYEAIFGKRFEPFWSPLVPSWMREEMGLQGWPKRGEREKDAAAAAAVKPTPEAVKTVKNETADKAKSSDSSKAEPTKMERASAEPEIKTEQKWPSSSQPTSYAYSSSTSWDSWSNKTKRVEWDSVSGRTRKYEYDPISNRMVQIEASPKAAESKGGEEISKSMKSAESALREDIPPTSKNVQVKPPVADTANGSTTKSTTNTKAHSIPVKQSSELRKSIPIPPPLSQPSHSIPLGLAKTTVTSVTSIGPVKSTAIAFDTPKPAALAKLPEKEVDTLTADQVRASMGKAKAFTTAETISEENNQITSIINGRDAIKPPKTVSAKTSEWDQAEMSVMLDKELETLQRKKEKLERDERGLFHIERQKRELRKLDDRIKEVTARVEKLNVAVGEPNTKAADVTSASGAATKSLQSSLDRMQSKELPKVAEPDDSAAHESTEAITALSAVPKNWAQQAELLQADRVRRATGTNPRPYPYKPTGRWIDDMQARKSAYEAEQAASKAATNAANSERQAKLEKANAMLEAEVKEQKFRMQAHENRYAHKIRSLRGELETAYKQSTVHSEKHLERIRGLEEELRQANKAADGAAAAGGKKVQKDMPKSPSLKELQKEEQKAKDRELVKEVREIYESAYGVIDAQHRQPSPPKEKTEPAKTPAAIANAAKEKKPKERQVVEVESDVDLGEALARYEREAPPYAFSKDSKLENEIAWEERADCEGKGPLFNIAIPKSVEKTKVETADVGTKLVDDKMPKLIPTELTKSTHASEEATEVTNDKATPEAKTNTDITWEDPPIYKVLAYDSGNDRMSTATTTSNFTTSEAPISIPQALSELYQPARFVPYFAELQREGYQVIFGTADLLVFKKVKHVKVVAAAGDAAATGLEDHGLSSLGESKGSLVKDVAAALGTSRSEVNPVDGTAKPTLSAPSTGNFASPTGFVNHDPVLPSEKSKHATLRDSSALNAGENLPEEAEEIEWRHYPRVRRMEQHFTGSRRRWNSNHRRHKRAEEREERNFNRKKRSTTRWIVGVGLGTATVMYVVGAAVERARHSQEVDWQRKAEEQGRRWR